MFISLRLHWPVEILRKLRSLNNLKMFKASEFKTCLLYAIPTIFDDLKLFFPAEYQLMLLLSAICHILLSDVCFYNFKYFF